MAKTSLKDKHQALTKHAGKQDTLEFSEEIKHGKLRFHKGQVVQFPSPAVAAYFDVAFNGTEFTDKEPNWVLTEDELNLDPDAPGETVDPDTVVSFGREGVAPGTTIFGHLNGDGPVSNAELKVDDVIAESRSS